MVIAHRPELPNTVGVGIKPSQRRNQISRGVAASIEIVSRRDLRRTNKGGAHPHIEKDVPEIGAQPIIPHVVPQCGVATDTPSRDLEEVADRVVVLLAPDGSGLKIHQGRAVRRQSQRQCLHVFCRSDRSNQELPTGRQRCPKSNRDLFRIDRLSRRKNLVDDGHLRTAGDDDLVGGFRQSTAGAVDSVLTIRSVFTIADVPNLRNLSGVQDAIAIRIQTRCNPHATLGALHSGSLIRQQDQGVVPVGTILTILTVRTIANEAHLRNLSGVQDAVAVHIQTARDSHATVQAVNASNLIRLNGQAGVTVRAIGSVGTVRAIGAVGPIRAIDAVAHIGNITHLGTRQNGVTVGIDTR